ncbi:unnamed protein product [Trichobilharzia regenti]|nr:unnamed protein product [Trichobilharzia regenti]
MKNCKSPTVSPEDLIQSKPPKHRRYSSWIWLCDMTITKERIRRQLNRSKTTVEEHLCYPWLRRLFFHLSNYFPNLHTTKSSRRRRPHSTNLSATSSLSHRQTDLNTSKTSNFYAHDPTNIAFKDCEFRQSTRINPSRFADPNAELRRTNNSPNISFRMGDSGSSISNGNRNLNTRSKRRPLQRQKSNGFTELDVELETSIKGRQTSGSSSENTTRILPAAITSKHSQIEANSIHRMRVADDNSTDHKVPEKENYSPPKSDSDKNSPLLSPKMYNSSAEYKNHFHLQSVNDERITPRSSDNQYCIQYKRVKARRTSSSSQAEFIKTSKNKGCIKDRPVQDNYQSNIYSSRQINEDYTNCTVNPGIYALNCLPKDQDPVQKHIETWLKEAVARKTQGKVQIRRSHMSHVSSGEAQREPPETVTPQPHSFDAPVSLYPDECLFTAGYIRRKPFSTSLHTSTDSQQIKQPSITRDSIDAPCYYEPAFEKYTEINNNDNRTNERLNLPLYDHTKLYRRHSDNPISEVCNKNYELSQEIRHVSHATHNTNSSHTSRDYDFSPFNTDRLLVTNISRERASSFQESNQVNKEYPYHFNNHDIFNNKRRSYNKNNSNNLSLSHHVNIMHTNVERSINPANLKQSHSFSERHKIPKQPIFTPPLQKCRLKHTLSEENRRNMMPSVCSNMNTSQSLRKMIDLNKSLQISIDSNYSQHINYELNRRDSKYSNMLQPNSSSDYSVFHPHLLNMHSERRYSRHLKPLDAWQNRQSHSMEIVNTIPINQRSSSSPQKRSPLSKQTAIRKLPAVYSRSLQHSTCSFPVHWGGFLSGPTLSLTSAFDSSSLTPDSLNHKHFFRSSLDSHEATQPVLLQQQQQQQQIQQRLQKSYRNMFSASVSESPNNLIGTEESITSSRHSRINLLPWSYNNNSSNLTQPLARKVHSFELNSNPHYQKLLPDLIRNNSTLLKVNDNQLSGHSAYSSRRGSSNSNNSVFFPKEGRLSKPKVNSEIASVQNSVFYNADNYHNPKGNNTPNTDTVSQSVVPDSSVKPIEKLIPPDLIFSPASRRASMMDEDISGIQDSTLNVTSGLTEFYLNHSNDEINTPNVSIETLHQDVISTKGMNNTNPLYYKNKHPGQLMNSSTIHQNSPNLPESYSSSDHHRIIPPSQLPILINKAYKNTSQYQSHIHVACCSQTDMRNIENAWDSLDNYNDDRGNEHNIETQDSLVQIQPSSDEELSDKSVPESLTSLSLVCKDYLFNSSRGNEINTVDPLLLKPSLRPIVDSSEENTSDPYENDTCFIDQSELMNISQKSTATSSANLIQSAYQRNKSSTVLNTNVSNNDKIDSHDARRRSFLARCWQQAIQQDDEQGHEDNCNIYESGDEFRKKKKKISRYESTGELNHYKCKYNGGSDIHRKDYEDDCADDIDKEKNLGDPTTACKNKSLNNTRCKSSESGLNYLYSNRNDNNHQINSSIVNSSNKLYFKQIPLSMRYRQQKQETEDYYNTNIKPPIKSKYH